MRNRDREGFATVRIYTKGGDEGETGLLYGGRVSKSDLRCEAYGSVDEAVSALGLARSTSRDTRVQAIIKELQRDLFTVGAELATDVAEYAKLKKHFSVITEQMTEHLEHIIDELASEVILPQQFIIPGASPTSAALDMARSSLRRAERRAVQLQEAGQLYNKEVLKFLNRAADLIFMLARYQDRELPIETLS